MKTRKTKALAAPAKTILVRRKGLIVRINKETGRLLASMELTSFLPPVPIVEGQALALSDMNRPRTDNLVPITVEQVKGKRAYFVLDGERFSFGQDGKVHGQGGELRVWASSEAYFRRRELLDAAFEFRKACSDFEERAVRGGGEFEGRLAALREATGFLKTC